MTWAREVYIALTKANAGQGIVAGLSVAFIAIVADRVVNALAEGPAKEAWIIDMSEAIERAARLSCFNDPQDIQELGGGITNVNLTLRDGGRRYVVRLGDDIPEHGVFALERAGDQSRGRGQPVSHRPSFTANRVCWCSTSSRRKPTTKPPYAIRPTCRAFWT